MRCSWMPLVCPGCRWLYHEHSTMDIVVYWDRLFLNVPGISWPPLAHSMDKCAYLATKRFESARTILTGFGPGTVKCWFSILPTESVQPDEPNKFVDGTRVVHFPSRIGSNQFMDTPTMTTWAPAHTQHSSYSVVGSMLLGNIWRLCLVMTRRTIVAISVVIGMKWSN